jgi:translation initiation factor IF-3
MSKKRKLHKTNEEIYAPMVRVTGEDIESKVISKNEAIQIAIGLAKDVILINENANPPVVRIEDYNKFLYKQEQKEKEQKQNSKKIETKEIGLSSFIADNDLNTKARKAIEFLNDGNKVKLNLLLKSREKARPEQGEIVIYKFLDLIKEIGSAEALPKYENNRWGCLVKPKK